MSLVGCKGESHSLMAAEVPDICAPLFRPSVPDEEVMAFSKLQLGDDYMNNRHVNVDILKFSDDVKFIYGRYEVSLPWKSDVAKQSLKNNEKLACKRLENLNLKFVKTPGLRERYDEVFEEYEKDDIIEEVPHSEISSVYPVYYLPHRPVIRESSNSTKIITKAFLQIKVQREDQDVRRFLWQNKCIVRVMRFVRVPFGNKSSPFLLNATIKHHVKSYPNSEVVDELNCNLYVDDWLSGADSIPEACVKFDKACKIMSEAGMSSKWNSNCKSLADKFSENPDDCCRSKSIKILGMQWVSTHDYFSFSEVNVGSQMGEVSTKRSVLSLIARCFDPLGLISPFAMFAKILFQDVWRIELKWDDVLPEELHCKFQRWLRGFEKLSSWKVQRCYFEDLSWKDLTGLGLHSFGDASEKGYGACVYLRVPL
ncbi:uncharacterized protein [Macrobrachium rosenbergii]|uniref:uncharacterized protein n=1 Tax=Macrobrachium rosenbergii TaxID=79674 RepID=UPI0034D6495B